MGYRCGFLTQLLCFLFATGLLNSTHNSNADYPWIHHFERPEMPNIQTAFGDAEGHIIVSTGDWQDGRYIPGYWIQEYWSEGMYRLNCDTIETIDCPDDTFVLDGAVDSHGRIWLLFGEGLDVRIENYKERLPANAGGLLKSDVGYRQWRYPVARGNVGDDFGLARLEETQWPQSPLTTDAIPGRPDAMRSGPGGRLYMISREMSDASAFGLFISCWDVDLSDSLCINDICLGFDGAFALGYPVFDAGGLPYWLVRYSSTDTYKEYAVLSVDPCTHDWHIYSRLDYPLLDSVIKYFYVDSLNIKWFGTEDGLVGFDGENWSRHTTENSGLPHNLVRQMAYDEVDETYYVVTSDRPEDYYDRPDWTAAFSAFSSRGEMIGEPVYCDWTPAIYRGAGDVWYLSADADNGSTVYSYDHKTIMRWQLSDWVNTTSPYVGYIGPTSTGRTFLVTRTCVMIW